MWIFKKRFPRTGPRPKPPVVRSSPNIAGFETQETTETRVSVDEGRRGKTRDEKMQSELSKTQMYCSELHFPTEVLACFSYQLAVPFVRLCPGCYGLVFVSFCPRARGALGRADFLLADVRSITFCNVVSVSTEIRTILGHVASPNQSRGAQKIRHIRGGRDKSGFESALTKPFQSLSPSFRPGGFPGGKSLYILYESFIASFGRK